jgi:hypothetical protein
MAVQPAKSGKASFSIDRIIVHLPSMKRLIPVVAVLVALAIAGVTALALGGADHRPAAVPPLGTPRLKALWDKPTAAPAAPVTEEDNPSDDETPTPTLNVLTAGGLPEEPNRHDLEDAMEKVRKNVEACQLLEQFAGIVQVRVTIDRSGTVKNVRALEPLDETQTGQCVAKEVKHASFPPFRGTLNPTIELVYPFYFKPPDN